MLPSASSSSSRRHRRVHAVRVPVEVPGDLVELALGDVRGVDELVTTLHVAQSAVVLHLHADHAALGVEHGQPGADLLREGEQVQLGAQPTVVAALRLGDALEVGAQLVLGGPRGAVDTLQLRVLLAAPPVGGGRARQLEAVAQHPGAGDVRSAAEVLPDDLLALATGATHVLVDAQPAQADLDRRALGRGRVALEPDELELVRLLAHGGAGLVLAHVPAPEGLALLDDPPHDLLDRLEVLRGERDVHVEVVVETVSDRRADAQLCGRVDLLDGLREHVRRRVPQHGQAVGLVDGHGLHDGAGGQRQVEVTQLAVHADDQDVAPGGVQVGTRRPRLHRGRDPVDGEGDELGHRYCLLHGGPPGRRATRCYRRSRRPTDLIYRAGGAGPLGRPLLIEWAIPDSNR